MEVVVSVVTDVSLGTDCIRHGTLKRCVITDVVLFSGIIMSEQKKKQFEVMLLVF